jgi:AraC-like DNA-binding protein
LNTPLLFLAIDVAAVVCAALVATRVLTGLPRVRGAQMVGLLGLSMICAVLLSHQEYGPWMPPAFRIDVGGWAWVLNLGRNVSPGLLMLLCHSLFTERRRFPKWLLGLLVAQLLLEEPGRNLIPADWPHARLATQTAPALLQTLFAGVAVYWTVADWRGDLVESRRRTRGLILAVLGLTVIASSLLTRVLIDPDNRASYLVHVALNGAFLAILVLVLFRLMGRDLRHYLAVGRDAPARRARRPRIDAETEAALARLTALLETERVCEEPRLSLRGLADRVGLPEYRLRRLIHEALGYQNFNALLHDYRVKAACRQLGDPGLRRTPILTIALSVGYSSVNTFNRGFREVMGVTPSVYRADRLTGTGGEIAPESE